MKHTQSHKSESLDPATCVSMVNAAFNNAVNKTKPAIRCISCNKCIDEVLNDNETKNTEFCFYVCKPCHDIDSEELRKKQLT